jgi:predicted  nucleic acid-binding Zn-ribbon protein
MYRECDDCKGIFKIPSKLESYLIKHPKKIIYCPYCNCVYSHVYLRQYEHEIVNSKRGKIYG